MVNFLKNLFLFVSLFVIVSCGYDKKSKKKHHGTKQICSNKLYVETYNVFGSGGAVGGDMDSDYLTDSVNFRMYIGTYDFSKEGYYYECKNDSVYIKKASFSDNYNTTSAKAPSTITEKIEISLIDLRSKHKFE